MENIQEKSVIIELKAKRVQFKSKEDFNDDFDVNDRQNPVTKGAVTIYRMTSKKSKKFFSVRFVEYPKDSPQVQQEEKTIRKVRLIKHSNVIKYHEIYTWNEGDKTIFVCKMDYIEKSLEQILQEKASSQNKKFTDIQLLWMVKQGLAIIDYLRDQLLLSHHGISPSNIFVTPDEIWKFSGFDNAQQCIGEIGTVNISQIQNSLYLSPELVQAKNAAQNEVQIDPVKSDLFSLGLVIMKCVGVLEDSVLEGINKDCTDDTQQALSKLARGPKVSQGGAKKFYSNIIFMMCTVDPNARIQMDDLKFKINNATIRQELQKEDKKKSEDKPKKKMSSKNDQDDDDD